VYANGELCLDILQNRWSPTYDVSAILTSIQSLLHDPNPNSYAFHILIPLRERVQQLITRLLVSSRHSPANAEAAQLFRDNLKEYNHRVRNTVELSWMDDEPEAAS